MRHYKVLILTQHAEHSSENSLYPLATALRQSAPCQQLAVATRSDAANNPFFKGQDATHLQAIFVEDRFVYEHAAERCATEAKAIRPADFDVIILRLPHPVTVDFLHFLEVSFPNKIIINKPAGILKVANKAFLLTIPDLCPPIRLCEHAADVRSFSQRFAIVLKPLRNYGGKGIVKIADGQAESGGQTYDLDTFLQQTDLDFPYLGMKFLKNVKQGDKRILVVNGQYLGASLRIPPPDSWLCNVSQGGSAHPVDLEPEEKQMVAALAPTLLENGIVMAGLDTLVNDDGKRVISEINALSIGGFHNIKTEDTELPTRQAAKLIWGYITQLPKPQLS